MDTEKCRILLAVIEEGSFSAAAARLGYTPSGVMRVVNALEKEIGFPVVARSPKGIVVTRDGKRLVPTLREFIWIEERIHQISADVRGLVTGDVSVGTYFSVAANWLPSVVGKMQRAYPQVHIAIEEGGNRVLYQGLEERRYDCCITTYRPFQGDWIPLAKDEMMVWLPMDHPYAKAAAYPIEKLAAENFIQILPGQDTDTEWLMKEEHIQCQKQFSSVDNYTIYRLVEAGIGVSMNNKLMTASWNGHIAIVPMDPPHYIELGIAVPSMAHASPAVRKFIDYMLQWVERE